MDEMLKSLKLIDAILQMSKDKSFRNNALTDAINEYVIDTCWTCDCGWETAIIKNNDIKIVSRYVDDKKAKEGHNKWIDKVKDNSFNYDSIKDLGYMEVQEEILELEEK